MEQLPPLPNSSSSTSTSQKSSSRQSLNEHDTAIRIITQFQQDYPRDNFPLDPDELTKKQRDRTKDSKKKVMEKFKPLMAAYWFLLKEKGKNINPESGVVLTGTTGKYAEYENIWNNLGSSNSSSDEELLPSDQLKSRALEHLSTNNHPAQYSKAYVNTNITNLNDLDLCAYFVVENYKTNPGTGATIKPNSPVYNHLMSLCTHFIEDTRYSSNNIRKPFIDKPTLTRLRKMAKNILIMFRIIQNDQLVTFDRYSGFNTSFLNPSINTGGLNFIRCAYFILYNIDFRTGKKHAITDKIAGELIDMFKTTIDMMLNNTNNLFELNPKINYIQSLNSIQKNTLKQFLHTNRGNGSLSVRDVQIIADLCDINMIGYLYLGDNNLYRTGLQELKQNYDHYYQIIHGFFNPRNSPIIGSPKLSPKADSENAAHDESLIVDDCKAKFPFEELQPHYQPFIKQMQRICSRIIDKTRCLPIPDLYSSIKTTYQRAFSTVTTIPITIDAKNPLLYMLPYWINNTEEDKKYIFRRLVENNNTGGYFGFGFRFTLLNNAAIDAGGVSRDTLTSLPKFIKNGILRSNSKSSDNSTTGSNMFIKIGDRYSINPYFDIDKLLDYNSYQGPEAFKTLMTNMDKKQKTLELYKFVGAFYAFCILNNIGIDLSLSYSILYQLLSIPSAELDINKLTAYYLTDNEAERNSILTIMKSDDFHTIIPNYYEKAMNDNIDEGQLLHSNGSPVADTEHITKDTFIPFIKMISYHKQINDPRIKDNLNAFITGFRLFRMNEVLLNKSVNIYTLDQLLSSREITDHQLDSLVNQIHIYPHLEHPVDREIQEVYYDWLCNIISQKGTNYPITAIEGETTHDANKRKKTEFILFIRNLLKFWTGNDRIPPENTSLYLYFLNEPDDSRDPHTYVYHLPRAATCSRMLKIPVKPLATEEETDKYYDYDPFYKRLVIAATNGGGFSFAGGKRLKQR